MKIFKIGLMLLVLNSMAFATQIFVATDGKDTNNGTMENPYKTIPKAISAASVGDTIYVRGGLYALTSTINLSAQDGNDSTKHNLFAYPGELSVLDYRVASSNITGIKITGRYWYVKGFEIVGAPNNGIRINGGSYNTIEFCLIHENGNTGLQLGNGASYNRIINCDSYYNADPPDYGDADGFAPKLDVGTGNYFYGCRSWGNCDDGWDGYMRGADDVSTTLENCWTWGNGYLKNGTDPGSQANGNGFKMGGGDNSNSAKLMHHFTLKNCLAFSNKNKGFDQNNNVGSMTLLNCSGYDNGAANYRILKTLNDGQILTVKNCVSFSGSVELGDFAVQETNSWLTPFDITEDDFISLDTTGISAPRKENGSLPDVNFMHLAQGSDLIDAGVDVGLDFNGSAPDLGAFESNYNTVGFGENPQTQETINLVGNYPNPFNPSTKIVYIIPKYTHVELAVYDIKGGLVAMLVDTVQTAGTYEIKFDGSKLSSGIYLYRFISGNKVQTKKMMLVK